MNSLIRNNYIILIAIIITTPSIAYSYLDPGTGNVLINLIIAGIAAFFYSARGLFYYILSAGKQGKKSSTNQHELTKIAIFSEGKQYWSTFNPIISALIAKKQTFEYYTLDVEDPFLAMENEYIKPKFLGYGAIAQYRFSRINSPILLSTTPNIGTDGYPLKRPARIKSLIHVFHSINDISPYKKGSLDYYDEVILVGDFQAKSIREIENIRNLPEKKLITLGLPYLDEFITNKKNLKNNDSIKTVLIGSSWGSKGCLNTYGTDFIRLVATAGYNVIVRPHPQSFKTELNLLEKYKDELKHIKNIEWDEKPSPVESMNMADILISDTSSIRFDFSFIYEKPVITLDIRSEEMPGFERDDLNEIWTDSSSEKIGFIVCREDINQLTEIIEKALVKFDSTRIGEYRDLTVKNYGKAGFHIAEYLSDKSINGD